MMIQVQVGLSSELLIPEQCRSWHYTSEDFERDRSRPTGEQSTLSELCIEASNHALHHMDPRAFNFVNLQWLWL